MSALDDGRLPDGTGLSQAEPKVSAVPASIPDAARDPMAMAMFAAWVNVTVAEVPDKFKSHTCAATMTAWQRVGRAALAHISENLMAVFDEAAFLCARVRELEGDITDDDTARAYYGHVLPSVARLERIVAQGIDAGTVETEGLDPKDESPVGGSRCAQSEAP